MSPTLTGLLTGIVQQPLSAAGTLDQLHALRGLANRLGFYDAADFLRDLIARSNTREVAPEYSALAAVAPVIDLQPIFAALPKMCQRQDGTNDQLADLRVFAVKLGLSDAADLISQSLERPVKRAQASEAAQ